MSQEYVAKKLRCHKNTITNIENGEPTSYAKVEDYAFLLGIKDPDIILLRDADDALLNSIIVLHIDTSKYESLEAALAAHDDAIKHLATIHKRIELKISSIIVTTATDVGAFNRLSMRYWQNHLREYGVFLIEGYHLEQYGTYDLRFDHSFPAPMPFPDVRADVLIAIEDAVRRGVYGLGLQQADVDDINSSIYLKLAEGTAPFAFSEDGDVYQRRTLQEPTTFLAWVNKTARRAGLAVLQKRAQEDAVLNALIGSELEPVDQSVTPPVIEIAELQAAMRKLPDLLRIVLERRYFHDETLAEVALYISSNVPRLTESYPITIGYVRGLLFRARSHLLRALNRPDLSS
jgi:DNA-directed RNA polymerase specialized sigma24 family protein/transcriptional regulator with XRE-family HTH domain